MLRRVENYEQAWEWLCGRINYERALSHTYSASDFKLTRMEALLRALGDPHRQVPAVHIAGTKGKGSTAAFTAGILSAAGYRTGLFTSPHLSAFEERMTVGGVRPGRVQVVELVNSLIGPVSELDEAAGRMSPTYFELTTAMAWLYFRQQEADIVVLEVGLGGRLDATNVCDPAVCVLTSISRDHTHLLGSELSQIAFEKAGIVKPHVPVVSGVLPPEARQVVLEVCQQRGAPLAQLERDFQYAWTAGEAAAEMPGLVTIDSQGGRRTGLPVPLRGRHQGHNAALAVMAAECLQQQGWEISEEAIRNGLATVRWPARVEVVRQRPTVIIDAAHNWESVGALCSALREGFSARSRILIFAATKDKDLLGMLRRLLPEFETVILTTYLNNPRAVEPEEVYRTVSAVSTRPVHLAPDPATAWKLAQRFAGPEDLICVTGSFFIAAEIRELILEPDPVPLQPSAGDQPATPGTL